MKNNMSGLLYWLPRILGILLALFISVFALDVFGEGYDFWQTALALTMHLLPTLALVIVLVCAWRWERLGGLLFIALAIVSPLAMGLRFSWEPYLLLSGIPLLIGVLFLVSGYVHFRHAPREEKAI